jgi:hypothetical protein
VGEVRGLGAALIKSGNQRSTMNEREQYMLNALRVIASYGKQGKIVLRPYMIDHKLKWDNDDDVKVWMRRIAEDAIKYAVSVR